MNSSGKKRVFTVLCIDGGGVRGLVPARILQEIEEKTGKPAAELFDLIGGPSTGAIVAAGLTVPDPEDPAKPKYSAEELKNFYYKHCPKIFPKTRFKNLKQLYNGSVYDPKPLDEAFVIAYGDARMRDSLTHLMIPATDIKHFKPVWITNFKGEKDTSVEGWGSMLLRDAVRASTTAPTYFPAKYYPTTPNEDMPNVTHRHALIDGGFFSGNTLHRLLTQAKRLAPPDAEIVFVHLGTGILDNSVSPEEFNRLGPLGLVSKSHGSILLSLAVNMSIIDAAQNLKEDLGPALIELDGKMPMDNGPMAMDDSSLPTLQALERFAESVMQNKAEELERLYQKLDQRAQFQEMDKDSKQALNALGDILRASKSGKELTDNYRRMLEYAGGIDDGKTDTASNLLRDKSKRLSDKDKAELGKVYKTCQSDIAREESKKLGNTFKKAVNSIVTKLGSKKKPPEGPKGPAL